MLFRHRYHDGLAQASYLIGCQAAGEAVVVDPNREVQQYLDLAAAEGLRIVAVTETHVHADFVSGARELARAAGARLYLSGEGPTPAYDYAVREGATLIRDGDTITVGGVRLDVVHTPGHTPEHVCFVVTDTATSPEPMGMLTGDFLFVGDVGRPDLLERAVGVAGSADSGARDLHRSLGRLARWPDFLQVWPGHGAGSACGRSLGAVPQSTLGYERRVNWALARPLDEDAFVRAVLEGQPEPPRYFAEMKRMNREGPPILGGFRTPRPLAARDLPALLDGGSLVVDLRPAADYAAGHVPGTLSITLNRSFATWAGSLLPYDRDVYLLAGADPARELAQAVHEMAMIGLDRVAGSFGPDALDGWRADSRPVGTVEQLAPADLAAAMAGDAPTVLDVRNRSEWAGGHVPGARHIPLPELPQRLDEIPRDRPLVVGCQAGGRSFIATTLLRRAGFGPVANLAGGYAAWSAAGLPVEIP